MTVAARRFVIGASTANLVLLGSWALLFQHRSPDAFFLVLTGQEVVAALLNVLGAGVVAVLLGAVLDRWAGGVLRRVLGVGVLLVLVCLATVARQGLHLSPGSLPGLAGLGMLALGLLGAALLIVFRPALLFQIAATTALIFSPLLLLTIPRAAWIGLTGQLNQRFGDNPGEPEMTGPRVAERVVWVIFDELDYRLAFGERPAGLALPAFDRLAGEAIVAEAAYPPAANTNESLPSLILGQAVEHTEGAGPREAWLWMADSTRRSTDGVTPVFASARKLGANSGMVGWNLAFCRTGLGRGLSRCSWSPSGLMVGRRRAVSPTMVRQWLAATPVNTRAIYRARFLSLQAEAERQAADSSLDLVVLHLPVPHEPWLFDRDEERLTLFRYAPSGYLDNLALADRSLARLRTVLDSSGLAGRTALIVTSDHPWRHSADFDGRHDPRVPLLIYLPWDGTHRPVPDSIATLGLGRVALDLLQRPLPSEAVIAGLTTPEAP
ncbi:MAG: sulfatase-like hydrolase/transferase [Gemmatimonadales bacterium]